MKTRHFRELMLETTEAPNTSLSSTTSNDSEDSSAAEEVSTISFLKGWSLKHNISHTAINDLLVWFSSKPDISGLPLCARTLLKTPVDVKIERLGLGEFHYFGLKLQLRKLSQQVINYEEFILDFGIDGLPLYKSTNLQFWPILCKVKIFPVAIYCGKTKPVLSGFLERFVSELLELKTEGILGQSKSIKIIVRAFCCDAPARAFIKNIKGHNGYYGCDKCVVSSVVT